MDMRTLELSLRGSLSSAKILARPDPGLTKYSAHAPTMAPSALLP